jgi:hypothetical protein
MKIIGKSNFDLETVNDILIAENVKTTYAKFIASALNDKFCTETSKYFFEAKPDEYKLYVWEP